MLLKKFSGLVFVIILIAFASLLGYVGYVDGKKEPGIQDYYIFPNQIIPIKPEDNWVPSQTVAEAQPEMWICRSLNAADGKGEFSVYFITIELEYALFGDQGKFIQTGVWSKKQNKDQVYFTTVVPTSTGSDVTWFLFKKDNNTLRIEVPFDGTESLLLDCK